MAWTPGFVDMINDDLIEVERVDAWETCLRAEGKCLDPSLVRHRAIVKKRIQMIEHWLRHRDAFMEVLDGGRKK